MKFERIQQTPRNLATMFINEHHIGVQEPDDRYKKSCEDLWEIINDYYKALITFNYIVKDSIVTINERVILENTFVEYYKDHDTNPSVEKKSVNEIDEFIESWNTMVDASRKLNGLHLTFDITIQSDEDHSIDRIKILDAMEKSFNKNGTGVSNIRG